MEVINDPMKTAADSFMSENPEKVPKPAVASKKDKALGVLIIFLGIALIVVTIIIVTDILTGNFTAGTLGYTVLQVVFILGMLGAMKLSGWNKQ